MATSQYFSLYKNQGEQRLIEDLIVESIKIMGTDVFYLPNDNDAARDLLYGEDPVRRFESAFTVEIYSTNATEYGGEKEFFSKFGLEIKNQVSVIMSKRSFSQRVPQNRYSRPREGDLMYIPFLNGTGELYEIKFVNQTKDFFMLGRQVPYFYELELEKFRYSQEVIQTGDADIDDIVSDSAYTIHFTTSTGNANNYIIKEIAFQSPDGTQNNATSVGIVSSWLPRKNSLSLTNISGEFIDNREVIGAQSNARFVISTYDPLNNPAAKEVYDNQYINIQAGNILDSTENNPFGNI